MKGNWVLRSCSFQIKRKGTRWRDPVLPLKELGVWVMSPRCCPRPFRHTSPRSAVPVLSLLCFLAGEHCGRRSPRSVQIHMPTDEEFCWIACNSVGRRAGQTVIPADPPRTFLFISDMLWARRKDLVQSALGFCSVRRVVFSSLAYSHFLNITERTLFLMKHEN